MKYLFVLLTALLGAASFTGAHGLGQTLTTQIDGYQVDVDYDVPVIEAGVPVRFDFRLWKGEVSAGEPASFSGVWLRLDRHAGKGAVNPIVFSGNLGQPEFGAPGVTYAFPEEGSYNLFVRFESGKENVAEATFPLSVEEGTAPSCSRFPHDAVLGVIGGTILGLVLGRALFRVR